MAMSPLRIEKPVRLPLPSMFGVPVWLSVRRAALLMKAATVAGDARGIREHHVARWPFIR